MVNSKIPSWSKGIFAVSKNSSLSKSQELLYYVFGRSGGLVLSWVDSLDVRIVMANNYLIIAMVFAGNVSSLWQGIRSASQYW